MGTFDTLEDATDARQPVEVAARRRADAEMNNQIKAGLSPRTRIATWSTLRSILQFAVDNGRWAHRIGRAR